MSDVLKIVGINSKGYGIIPKLVMQDQRLTRDAKCIYAYFKSFAGAGDTAFPSVKKICEDLNYGTYDTYKKHFDLLTKYGYISVERFRNKGRFDYNVYTMHETVEDKGFSPIPKKPVSVNSVSKKQVSKKRVSNNNNKDSFNNNNNTYNNMRARGYNKFKNFSERTIDFEEIEQALRNKQRKEAN